MVKLKTEQEIAIMAEAAGMVARTLDMIGRMVSPGVTTGELDRCAEAFIRQMGGVPTFKGYKVGSVNFPASICVSIDEEVVHGIPGPRILKEGQIVSVDIGVTFNGFVGDAAWTFAVGRVTTEIRKLLDVTRLALNRAIEEVRPGAMLSDIGRVIQPYVEAAGFNVVKKYVGHGIGRDMHEDPQIPNFVSRTFGKDIKLTAGMVLAIEPMVNAGTDEVHVTENGWTVVTGDGRPSAHFEHTVAVVPQGHRILSLGSAGLN